MYLENFVLSCDVGKCYRCKKKRFLHKGAMGGLVEKQPRVPRFCAKHTNIPQEKGENNVCTFRTIGPKRRWPWQCNFHFAIVVHSFVLCQFAVDAHSFHLAIQSQGYRYHHLRYLLFDCFVPCNWHVHNVPTRANGHQHLRHDGGNDEHCIFLHQLL